MITPTINYTFDGVVMGKDPANELMADLGEIMLSDSGINETNEKLLEYGKSIKLDIRLKDKFNVIISKEI